MQKHLDFGIHRHIEDFGYGLLWGTARAEVTVVVDEGLSGNACDGGA